MDYLGKQEIQKHVPSEKWRKASAEYVKINIDGSFNDHSQTGGWGFVTRDSNGLLGARAGNIQCISDPMQTELEACVQALPFATKAGMGRIELETDALNSKAALEGTNYDLSSYGVLIREAKFSLICHFLDVRVLYCSRSCNAVADKLAKFGTNLGPVGVMLWPDSVPSCRDCV